MSDSSDVVINIQDIMRMLPHRYPFLLVDKVVDLEPSKSAVGIKNVTMNEPFFQGHFPGAPVMPGVLIVEAMAQAAGVMVIHSIDAIDKGMMVYFMSIENAKFRKPVTPGDRLELHVDVVRGGAKVWKFKGRGIVDGVLVAEAEFTAMMIASEDL